jgi:hypothetical protein
MCKAFLESRSPPGYRRSLRWPFNLTILIPHDFWCEERLVLKLSILRPLPLPAYLLFGGLEAVEPNAAPNATPMAMPMAILSNATPRATPIAIPSPIPEAIFLLRLSLLPEGLSSLTALDLHYYHNIALKKENPRYNPC